MQKRVEADFATAYSEFRAGVKHYHLGMPSLRVQIVRFVDEEPQPGIVESQFSDAHGKVHSIINKMPMFANEVLWSDSEYPQPGLMECCVLERISDSGGNFARISIEPYHFELTNESSEFVVREADLSDSIAPGRPVPSQ